jgi:hypothetical protein
MAPNDGTVVSVGFAVMLALTSAAGLLYDWLHKNHQLHLWPDPGEHERAIATVRYYRDVQDSSD